MAKAASLHVPQADGHPSEVRRVVEKLPPPHEAKEVEGDDAGDGGLGGDRNPGEEDEGKGGVGVEEGEGGGEGEDGPARAQRRNGPAPRYAEGGAPEGGHDAAGEVEGEELGGAEGGGDGRAEGVEGEHVHAEVR